MSLQKIQEKLKAPKSQFNNFGKYTYRNVEDIQEALKPLLAEYNYSLVIGDDVIQIGNRIYIKSTARLMDAKNNIIAENTAFAREPEEKKGMDAAQLTGATSSYSRKYCLGGMFLLDDTKDADHNNTGAGPPPEKKPTAPQKILQNQVNEIDELIKKKGADRAKLLEYYGIQSLSDMLDHQYKDAMINLKKKKAAA